MIVALLAGAAAWEACWWAFRRRSRQNAFNAAKACALATGKPLVVIGAPDGGVTAGYGCGDVTIDLRPSSHCPTFLSADIEKRLPFADDSVVVFVSCVLEYVNNDRAALAEIGRIGGRNVYLVAVEPWTLTAYLYPNAKRTLPRSTPGLRP